MPMLDVHIPEGALTPAAEQRLLARATDLLLEHEGVDPTNEKARQLAWIFVHHPKVYVAGAPATAPRYRFICQVPEGQYDDNRRQAVTAALTDAVVEAEAGAYGDDTVARVWVFTNEIPDGTWGGLGSVVRLPDLAAYALGEEMREVAARALRDRHRQEARAILEAAGVEEPVVG